MHSKNKTVRYVAFLRGINVGGHHKVPMPQLKIIMEELGFKNVITILNSGNIIFDSVPNNLTELESTISEKIESIFSFPVPTLIRNAQSIIKMFNGNPFHHEENHKDIRRYVSFLRNSPKITLDVPWTSVDNSYKIIEIGEATILSVLDLSITKTPNAMENLEKVFGKDITTRNWNTIERIVNKI